MRGLTLVTTLPPKPTWHRVGVWRKLQRMGALRLRGAGWILPETPETIERYQWLVQEIQSFRGEATLLRVDRVETMTGEEIAALFHKARADEYQAVVLGCRDILRHLDRYQADHRRSIPQLVRGNGGARQGALVDWGGQCAQPVLSGRGGRNLADRELRLVEAWDRETREAFSA